MAVASNDRNIAIIIHPAGKNCKHFSEKRAIFGEKTAQKMGVLLHQMKNNR